MSVGYGIFSGGLDSMLAACLLRNQGVEVHLITFTSPFFGTERALRSGRQIGLCPEVIDITGPHLEMMRQPKHGFGRFMNPCIDCHALMFRQAGEVMESRGGDFLFSGEVLGQRPKSQNRGALNIVARESGFADYVLRPLSARVLPPTRMEERGLVDRSRLMGFSGRSRKPQMALAEEYGLKDYPSPAGGCLLTDVVFSRRLKELTAREGPPRPGDIEFIKYGRHFRLPDGARLVVGRNQAENQRLETLKREGDLILKTTEVPGPLAVLPRGTAPDGLSEEDLRLAASMVISYSDARDGNRQRVQIQLTGSDRLREVEASGRPKDSFSHLMI